MFRIGELATVRRPGHGDRKRARDHQTRVGAICAGHVHIAVEAVSAYWHFVDIVWIFLFFTLYFLK